MQHYHNRGTSEASSPPPTHPPPSFPSMRSRSISRRRALPSSATWTSSSADQAMTGKDEFQDRRRFISEYNRLAKKHDIRGLVPGDFQNGQRNVTPNNMTEKRHWWSRLLRSVSHGRHRDMGHPGVMRQRRSLSDLAIHLRQSMREPPKTLSLQAMVRLNGQSLLYLPAEFAVGTLRVPTCFRATAQYLAQHGSSTRGIFRIPGSVRVVNALFDYYFHEIDDEEITQTTRCPSLPIHITIAEHDVGSAFKKFLSVLPGGILGSLSVFDALVSIHSQLNGGPEHNRTRQTKLRARLIALAISTVESQFQRDLIHAVFGLLSLIGRQAEMAPREDEHGYPLPTSDLMGYKALGIVFGPLLVGNLLDSYTMRLAHPPTGLLLFPLTPPKLKRERSEALAAVSAEGPPTVDKILVVNDITEMIITHWREVIRQLKNIHTMDVQGYLTTESSNSKKRFLSSSASEAFTLKKPQSWGLRRSAGDGGYNEDVSKTADTPTPSSRPGILKPSPTPHSMTSSLHVKRLRPRNSPSGSSTRERVSARQSTHLLSPTAEEGQSSNDYISKSSKAAPAADGRNIHIESLQKGSPTASLSKIGALAAKFNPSPSKEARPPRHKQDTSPSGLGMPEDLTSNTSPKSQVLDVDEIHTGRRERHKSQPLKQGLQTHMLCRSNSDESDTEHKQTPSYNGSPVRSVPPKKQRSIVPVVTLGVVSERLRSIGETRDRHPGVGNGIFESSGGKVHTSTASGRRNTHPTMACSGFAEQTHSQRAKSTVLPSIVDESDGEPDAPDSRQHRRSENVQKDCSSSIQTTPERFLRKFDAPMQEPQSSAQAVAIGHGVYGEQSATEALDKRLHTETRISAPSSESASQSSRDSMTKVSNDCVRVGDDPFNRAASQPQIRQPPKARAASVATVADKVAEIAHRNTSTTAMNVETMRKRSSTLAVVRAPTTPKSDQSKPSRVRAMAALWESSPKKDDQSPSSVASMLRKQPDGGGRHVVSPYATNTTPSRQPAPTVKLTSERSSSKGSIPSLGRGNLSKHEPAKKTLRTTTSDSAILRATSRDQSHQHEERPPMSHPESASRIDGDISKPQPLTQTGSHLDSDNPRSLGRMTPHQEQPPVDKHISFSRPPSGTSLRTVNELEGECVEASDHPTSSQLLSGGNCILHAQIRSLTKQLEVRTEEISSLRRQLETKENMDIGTLSEQLRESKRECVMWRCRAEAAEKRVAVFERFTSKLRGIRGTRTNNSQAIVNKERKPSGQSTSTVEKNMLETGSEASAETSKTEEPEVLATRIRHSLRELDGARSESLASSASLDGGAGAWWATSPRQHGRLPDGDMSIVQSAEEILMAADEFLAHADHIELADR